MRKGPHPALFAVLILPYGAAFGFVAFALQPLMVRHGIAESAAADLIALTFLVHTLKPIWAPVVDTTLTRKTWYLIALALSAVGIVAAAAVPVAPATLTLLTVVVMASQLGLTLMGMACESFMALTVPEDEKGRAAGWYNAGSFAGVGVGGWGALKLTAALRSGWMVGAILGAVMLPCALPLLGIPKIAHDHARRLGAALRQLGRDLAGLFVNAYTVTGLIIALSPVGASAMTNLFNAVAPRWDVDERFRWQAGAVALNADDILGLVNGLVGGLVSALGSMFGGWLADKLPRRLAYALAGASLAVAGVAMALAPRTPAMFVVFILIYALFAGLAYAAFSGFVLETIGTGCVATKYTVYVGCANLAIAYTTHFDGAALDRWGTTGMLLTDAGMTVAGIALLLGIVLLLRRRPTSPAA